MTILTTRIRKWRWVKFDGHEGAEECGERHTGEEILFETHRKTWLLFGWLPIWKSDKHCKIPWHVWASSTFLGGSVQVPEMHGEANRGR